MRKVVRARSKEKEKQYLSQEPEKEARWKGGKKYQEKPRPENCTLRHLSSSREYKDQRRIIFKELGKMTRKKKRVP